MNKSEREKQYKKCLKKLKKIKKFMKKELDDEDIDLKFIMNVDSKYICSIKADFAPALKK
jgi:hypothetical protein